MLLGFVLERCYLYCFFDVIFRPWRFCPTAGPSGSPSPHRYKTPKCDMGGAAGKQGAPQAAIFIGEITPHGKPPNPKHTRTP
jgi:hypothetical protein